MNPLLVRSSICCAANNKKPPRKLLKETINRTWLKLTERINKGERRRGEQRRNLQRITEGLQAVGAVMERFEIRSFLTTTSLNDVVM